jgi:hypothetical protein
MSDQAQARITSLISNDALARLEQLRINARGKFTDRHTGEHLAGSKGTSNEFADYRDYAEGDDIRRVDWNIFARLHKPYIKLFYEEQEKHVVLIIDNSASMQYENKLLRAQQLAVSFGFMGLLAGERVSVYSTNPTEESVPFLRAVRGRGNFSKIITYIEHVKAGGSYPIEAAIQDILKHHKGQGIALILSDFFTFGSLKTGLNRLFNSGLEIFGIQIMGPEELDPELAGDISLIDCETEDKIDISSSERVLEIYREYRDALEDQVSAMCRQRSGRFLQVNAHTDINTVLFDLLRRKGWVS